MFNTMDKAEYIKEHIIWSIILYIWCKQLLFRCISGCTYFESLFILSLVGIVVVGSGIVLSWKRGRNYVNLAENLIMSWTIYVVIAYIKVFKYRMLMIGILVLVISIFMTIIMFFQKIKRRNRRRLVVRNRVHKIVYIWKRNLTIGALLLLLPIVFNVLVNGTVLNSKVEVAKIYGDEHCLDNNIDVICDIEPERWKKLNMQQKLDVSQKIVNCEARYLGISHEISVGTADLDEGTLACYIESKHQIVVDIEYLESSYSYDILESLIHEVTHAYQHELINMYLELDEKTRNLLIFYPVSQYLDEFANYENGDKNYMLYYGQLAEIDARKAGRTEALVYIERVEEYLGLKETTLEE